MNENYGKTPRAKATNGHVIPRRLLDRAKTEFRELISYIEAVRAENKEMVKILSIFASPETVRPMHKQVRGLSGEIAKLVEVQTAIKRVLAGNHTMTRQETQKMEKLVTRMINSAAKQKTALGLAEVQRAVRKQKTLFR